MSCDGSKWECQYCTYLNWQSALKCTMCRSPKPLQVIEEGAPPVICVNPNSLSSLGSPRRDEESSYHNILTSTRDPPESNEYGDDGLITNQIEADTAADTNSSRLLPTSPNAPGGGAQNRTIITQKLRKLISVSPSSEIWNYKLADKNGGGADVEVQEDSIEVGNGNSESDVGGGANYEEENLPESSKLCEEHSSSSSCNSRPSSSCGQCNVKNLLNASPNKAAADLASNNNQNKCQNNTTELITECQQQDEDNSESTPVAVAAANEDDDSSQSQTIQEICDYINLSSKRNNKEVTNRRRYHHHRSRTPSPITTPPRISTPPRIVTPPRIISCSPSKLSSRNNFRSQSPPSKVKSSSPIPTTIMGAEKYISSSSPESNNCKSTSTTTTTNCSSTSTAKWTCVVCTYDNWPKSSKCVMCLCPRYLDHHHSDHHSGSPLVVGANEIIEQGNNSSPRYSTARTRSPNQLLVGGGGVLEHNSVPSIVSSIHHNNPGGIELFNYGSVDYEDDENSSLVRKSNGDMNSGANNTTMGGRGRRRNLFMNSDMDRKWLDACCGAVDGDVKAVQDFVASGGDPARQLNEAEVNFLDRPSAFDIGLTLIHLALRFQQEDVLAILLAQVDGGPSVVKRVPSNAAPNIAIEIRRHLMSCIRQRKGPLRCHFSSEIATFTLPSEIEDLPPQVQETLFDEVLDRDVQKELEAGRIINWSVEVCDQLNSRLYALWNRSAGDCLLDSVLQSTWGIFDRENHLRRALSDSLHDCTTQFYHRWKDSEILYARLINFSLNEAQCSADWANLLHVASQPGSSLEQLHIFALAHILRRPIIVYGVKYVKSYRGETLGFARFEGVYLPLLWEPSFCWKWPITLGYTRGHFSALVAMEPDCDPIPRDAASQLDSDDINSRSVYLPLTTVEGTLLPIQFLNPSEIGKEEYILSQWLDVSFTENGIMVARQQIQKRPLLVAQMVDEWLNHYRRLGYENDMKISYTQPEPPPSSSSAPAGHTEQVRTDLLTESCNSSNNTPPIASSAPTVDVAQSADEVHVDLDDSNAPAPKRLRLECDSDSD